MSWYLAPSLARLLNEVNAMWPHRDKSSDGTIGDAAHFASGGDHVPDAKGCVHALDIDSSSIRVATVVRAACRHPSTEYVISNRLIYTRESGFQPRNYSGEDPHISHIHVSIQHTSAAETSRHTWTSVPVTNGPILRLTNPYTKGPVVQVLQIKLHLPPDGVFGPITEAAVKVFQKKHGLVADGVVGPRTWAALG